MNKETYENIINDLASVINKYSLENNSNTPDYILAEYLFQCLQNFNEATVKRKDRK